MPNTITSVRMSEGNLVVHDAPDGACAVEQDSVHVEIGQWYWVVAEKGEWLGCVFTVGSNYVELREPSSQHGYRTARIHFDDFWSELRFEPHAEAVINGKVKHFQQEANHHLEAVKSITARLGVSQQAALPSRVAPAGTGGALVVLSGQSDIKGYEQAMVLARDKELPELFKAIKEANAEVTRWMTASALPMEAMAASMGGVIGEIKDRIWARGPRQVPSRGMWPALLLATRR